MSTATINSNGQLDHLALDMVLPWHEHLEQQEKFKRLLKKVVAPIMIFLLIMPLLPDLSGEEEVPEKIVAQLILDPPKVVPVEKPKPTEVKEQRTQQTKKDAVPKAGAANGLQSMQALAQQMAAMRNSVDMSKMQNKNVTVSNEGQVQKSSRSLLGQQSANSASGGLKASDLTVNVKGAALSGHQSSDVASPMMDIEIPTAAQYSYDPKKDGKRDGQSIRRTLERQKGGVFALFNKASRNNPELGGRFIFKFVIQPSGQVTNLKLVSSELNSPELEQKMLEMIKKIDFGKEDLKATDVEYTYNFFPS